MANFYGAIDSLISYSIKLQMEDKSFKGKIFMVFISNVPKQRMQLISFMRYVP